MTSKTSEMLDSFNLAQTISLKDINSGYIDNPQTGKPHRITMTNSVAYELRKHGSSDVIISFFTTKKGLDLAYIAVFPAPSTDYPN